MKCPYCSFHDTRVVDSRDAEGGESIRRRRECPACSQRFSTYERRSHRISRSGATEVPSSVVGEYAMEGLRSLDEIAYIRFASVYKEFADLNEMRGELEKIGR